MSPIHKGRLTDHLLGTHPFSGRDVETFRVLIERALIRALEPDGESAGEAERASSLRRLVDWIMAPGARRRPDRPDTIISTNYDIILEMEIFRRLPGHLGRARAGGDPMNERVDFGFSHRTIFDGSIAH